MMRAIHLAGSVSEMWNLAPPVEDLSEEEYRGPTMRDLVQFSSRALMRSSPSSYKGGIATFVYFATYGVQYVLEMFYC